MSIRNILRPVKQFSERSVLKTIKTLSPGSEWLGPPQKFCKNGKEYYQLHKSDNTVGYYTYSEESQLTTIPNLPGTINEKVHWYYEKFRQYVFPEQYVVTINDGRVTDSNCYIIGPDDCVVLDLSREFGKDFDPERMSLFKKLKLPSIQHQKGIVGVVGHTIPNNYFHWMLNLLPRIVMLRETGWLQQCDKIVINELNTGYQTETLKLLNIDLDKLVFSHSKFHLKADKLVVPSVPQFHDIVPAWAVNFARGLFIGKEPANKQKKRIYITRQKAKGRKILNEEVVMRFLKAMNFEMVEMEGLTVKEQAALFNSAAVIVAPHGASQTNLVFSDPGTIVVELFPSYWVSHIYWSLSEQLGLKYYYLVDKNLQEKIDGYWAYKSGNFEVSINDLERILAMAGVAQ